MKLKYTAEKESLVMLEEIEDEEIKDVILAWLSKGGIEIDEKKTGVSPQWYGLDMYTYNYATKEWDYEGQISDEDGLQVSPEVTVPAHRITGYININVFEVVAR